MGNERLPNRVIFGELGGGEDYLGGQEKGWMGCLERNLSFFNSPPEEKRWMLAAKKLDQRFKRVEEAVEQYIHGALVR